MPRWGGAAINGPRVGEGSGGRVVAPWWSERGIALVTRGGPVRGLYWVTAQLSGRESPSWGMGGCRGCPCVD